jgi:NADH:ubiquinone oxidoreductase subunit C
MKSKSFNVENLAKKRAQLKVLKAEIADLVKAVKEEKFEMALSRQMVREMKEKARAEKRAAAVAKLEARLAKLKNPKRPGPVTVYTVAEARALAA